MSRTITAALLKAADYMDSEGRFDESDELTRIAQQLIEDTSQAPDEIDSALANLEAEFRALKPRQ